VAKVKYAPKVDSQQILFFYMGKNRPERKDHIMERPPRFKSRGAPLNWSGGFPAAESGRLENRPSGFMGSLVVPVEE
jgi:hypothetical protein